MKKYIFIPLLTILFSGIGYSITTAPLWGFYAHRLINRLSVFTLPPELFGFYKANIAYMTEHAVDPDKRRYATKHEGTRHYIDIDQWDKIPFPNVPRDFEEAIIKHCKIRLVAGVDSIYLDKHITADSIFFKTTSFGGVELKKDLITFVKYWKKVIKPLYYEDQWILSGYDFDELFQTSYFQRNKVDIYIEDHFSEHGILPYHLEQELYKLTKDFESKNITNILRRSAEFGHYVGDALVPLHTVVNYNGHLTNQVGIHAFWESRIPELFAEEQYDFFVGKAEYIENPKNFIWDLIIKSHSQVDSVFAVEKRLSQTYDTDKIYCYDERLGVTSRIQCREYAEAYQQQLNGMVEDHMRTAIYSIGSLIYTAWVNAGQPKIDHVLSLNLATESIMPNPKVSPRPHED